MKYVVSALLVLSLTACTDTRKEDILFCQQEGGQVIIAKVARSIDTIVGCVFPKDWGNK